ncbi:Extracellular serine/threonine protein kinase FAM20C [Trichinella sp. T6]|nr:Extracellular serine/threonine protein kinase FAM20C [Trichinella sp. T6]
MNARVAASSWLACLHGKRHLLSTTIVVTNLRLGSTHVKMRFRIRYITLLLVNIVGFFILIYLVNRKCIRLFKVDIPEVLLPRPKSGNDLNSNSLKRKFFWDTVNIEVQEQLQRLSAIDWHRVKPTADCNHRFGYPPTSDEINLMENGPGAAWQRFLSSINSCEVYKSEETLRDVLQLMSKEPVLETAVMKGGTQVKLLITFKNGRQAVFKPMRFDRNHEANPNHFYFSDFERHNAEIAAFHLDKVLGYNRAIPTVGRVFNMTSELKEFADQQLYSTFFVSPVGNVCFVGVCKYYCMTGMAICGNPDTIEGSLQMFIDTPYTPFDRIISPYRRTYSKMRQKAEWQLDNSYCKTKLLSNSSSPFSEGRLLLDLIDMSILDFLMGNQDRHHMDMFRFEDVVEVATVHVDNGRGFGRSDFDDLDIILPLVQCCVIRPSTVWTLLKYYFGPSSLGDALKQSMASDPVSPVLADKHLIAVNRRLEIVLFKLAECIIQAGGNHRQVILSRLFNNNNGFIRQQQQQQQQPVTK